MHSAHFLSPAPSPIPSTRPAGRPIAGTILGGSLNSVRRFVAGCAVWFAVGSAGVLAAAAPARTFSIVTDPQPGRATQHGLGKLAAALRVHGWGDFMYFIEATDRAGRGTQWPDFEREAPYVILEWRNLAAPAVRRPGR